MSRDQDLALVREYTQSESLVRHMLAVESAMRAYPIKSHADYLTDCPRVSMMDKALYACDELCGFITAFAMVRPTKLEGLKAKSVRKKMKQASFAAAVNRDDIVRGADDLGVDLNEPIDFCILAMQTIVQDLDLA